MRKLMNKIKNYGGIRNVPRFKDSPCSYILDNTFDAFMEALEINNKLYKEVR